MILPLSILGTILWAVAIIVIIVIIVLSLIFVFLYLLIKSEEQENECGAWYLYYERELRPGLWAHNDGIASILIYEKTSGEGKDCSNSVEAWAIDKVESEEIPDSLGDGKKVSITTKNGRKWVYEMYIPDNWTWLIKLPLIRFLNDPEYRERIESKINDEECNSNIELLIACCLLHAPKYHTILQEEGKTQAQMDTEQAEKLLLSSFKKGNINAVYELICLYFEKGQEEKVISLNNAIKSVRGRGVWFVDRLEQPHDDIKNDSQ